MNFVAKAIGALAIWSCAGLLAGSALADQVVIDDLVVQGSLCVGIPCMVDEDFGFDTVRLRGDVVRLHFQDTSVSASFPTTDWRITINDDDGGSAERFSIDDATAGTTPFTLEGGAPTNSLYLDGSGRVGVGTDSPSQTAALDVRGTLRIDQIDELTGSVTGGVKAGVVPGTAFLKGEARVDFQAPYTEDYLVLLTPVNAKGKFRPVVIGRDATGFTIFAGKKNTKKLDEVHWMTQRIGE